MQINDRIADTLKIQQKFGKCKENIPPTHTHTHTGKNSHHQKEKTKQHIMGEKKMVRKLEHHFRWSNIQPKLVSEGEKKGKKLLFSRSERLVFWLLLPKRYPRI